MGRNFRFLSLFLFISFLSSAQQTAVFTNELAEFNRAFELYNNNQYLAAQSMFAEIEVSSKDESVKSDCAYYIANSAVRLNQQNADQLMEAFVEKYPTSIKRNSAYIDVANYYFENGNLKEIIKTIE